MLVGAFARAFGVGILPAMPGRGHRLWVARAIAASAAAAALLAAGCDGHSKPRAVDDPTLSVPSVIAAPDPTSTPRSTTVPSASTPPLEGESALNSAFPSAAARIPDAIETVRRFFDGLNHESDTGDEGPVIATFTTKCTLCGSEVYSLKSLLDGGRTLRGGHLHLLSIDSAAATYNSVVSIIVTSSEDASDQLDATGKVVHHFDAQPPTKLDFELNVDVSPPKIWQISRLSK
jgi:hypothetical protein